MTRFIYSGKVYPHEAIVEIDEVNYPIGRMLPAEREALGIEEVIEQPQPDTRYFYANGDPDKPGAWIASPISPEQMRQRLLQHAAERRWGKEIGGIEVEGLPVATDDRSKIMLLGARSKAEADPSFTPKWVAANGHVVTLPASDIIAISDVVAGHVDACFKLYAAVVDKIEDGTITKYEEIDAEFA